MNISSQKTNFSRKSRDLLKWIIAFFLTFFGIYVESHFFRVALAIRTAVGIVLFFLILIVIAQTKKGNKLWSFIKLSRSELRKVIWLKKQEMTQTTLLVVIMVLVFAFILWILDACFFRLVKIIWA